ncbi:NADPH-dependent FMN reductase [Antarcticirhabdus aurantiaca]|uniref:NAD(P)H-dependent oxidoreductase n=1 Tax=Antarcticirhabdus aurantiaca TaxID=2606717 RepID=A0ACD4NQD2_9HYPH|nr:NAD(P)H-dependent oxidoreductase [Antarcticirhabdus aurantiaca]WAJ28981.1 NAD(P)H-dependent oxidoreductase [Jeongeuplla avenae]
MTRILVLAGSNRTGSLNRRLADEAVGLLAASQAVEVVRLDLADYPLPIYDGDVEAASGLPDAALKLAGQLTASDAALLVSPEYNASVPPLLKNALDWASRVRRLDNRPVLPFRGLVVGLASASPGRFGGARSLSHLRDILVSLGSEVIARQCSIVQAGEAFDAEGRLSRPNDRDALEKLVESLVDIAIALRRAG